MAIRTLPDADYLRQCYEYDPDIGTLRWKTRPDEHFSSPIVAAQVNTRCAGKVCGYLNGQHMVAAINNTRYLAHRIIWKMVHGVDPIGLDHIDHDGANNRLNNLREATFQQNSQNMRGHRDRKSRLKGTYFRRGKGNNSDRWEAYITISGKIKCLGCFKTEEAAHEAYCTTAKQLFGEFWTPVTSP